MALVIIGTIVTFTAAGAQAAAIYVSDDGQIEAVQSPADPPPAGYAAAPRVDTQGVIYPGLIDLHNHLAYNLRSLWTPPHPEPYTTRYQWPTAPTYHAEVSDPARFLHAVAGEEALKYVEAKALVGGVTTIQGLSTDAVPSEGWLIHHIEEEQLASGQKAAYQSVLHLATPTQFAAAQGEMQKGSAFIYHLAEGSAPGLTSEFDEVATQGCLQPELVAIHATALHEAQYATWSQQRGSLVWSPLSNLWLYRTTTDVAAARGAGLRLCLGADWAPSGSKHVLGELKVADLWNTRHLDTLFSDQDLCAMVTANPADAVGLGGRIGRIKAGLRADLLVMPEREPDPYRNLIACTERDTALVLVAGRPVYGLPALMSAAGAQNVQPIGEAGLAQVISLPDPTLPGAHLSWTAVVTRLRAIQQHPQAVPLEAVRVHGEPPPFRLLLDMPWDQPLEAAEEHNAIPVPPSIPPLDTLVHDAAFFEALEQAPILGGVLNGLRASYGA